MKKTIFTLATVLLLFASCDRVRQYLGKAKDAKGTKEVVTQTKEKDKDRQPSLRFEHLTYFSPDSMVSISADVPAVVGTPLADSIMAYVGETFEAFATIYAESHDARKAFQYAGEGIHNQMTTEITEAKAEYSEEDLRDMEWMFHWTNEINLQKEYDCEHYITYVNVGDNYTGGAHGYHWVLGTTFNKETGKRIGKEILKNTNSQAFRTMFQKELLDYFTESDGENASDDLKEYLLIDINDLQISNMRITDKHFVFQYQPYEIACYAAGMPLVILPFDRMKPYLTAEGLRLIGE